MNFKGKKVAITIYYGNPCYATQVTAMGFLKLVTNMGMYDSLLPLIIPSIASPAVILFHVQLSAVFPSDFSCRSGKNRWIWRI